MAKLRDKKLMLDLLRYSATVMFRDKYITVIVPKDIEALNALSGMYVPRDVHAQEYYIIKTYIRHRKKYKQ